MGDVSTAGPKPPISAPKAAAPATAGPGAAPVSIAALATQLNNARPVNQLRAMASQLNGGVIQRTIIVGAGEDAETFEKGIDHIPPTWGFSAGAKAHFLALLNDGVEHRYPSMTVMKETMKALGAGPPPGAARGGGGAPPLRMTAGLLSAGRGVLAPLRIAGPADYAGTTVGVEQELPSGARVVCKKDDRGVFVQVFKAGRMLAELTSDMGGPVDYTIELRTSPVVATDQLGNADRKHAVGLLVAAVKTAGRDRRAIIASDISGDNRAAGFVLKIHNKNHRITYEDGEISGASNQISVGVQTDAMLGGSPESALLLKSSAWFKPRADAKAPFKDQAKAHRAFEMLLSAVEFLGGIYRSGNAAKLHDPAIKNSWQVLPRTSPAEWLTPLVPADREVVLKMVQAHLTDDFLQQAFDYMVMQKGALAGHLVPAATILGKHSSIFEFREVPYEMRGHVLGRDHDAPPPGHWIGGSSSSSSSSMMPRTTPSTIVSAASGRTMPPSDLDQKSQPPAKSDKQHLADSLKKLRPPSYDDDDD